MMISLQRNILRTKSFQIYLMLFIKSYPETMAVQQLGILWRKRLKGLTFCSWIAMVKLLQKIIFVYIINLKMKLMLFVEEEFILREKKLNKSFICIGFMAKSESLNVIDVMPRVL